MLAKTLSASCKTKKEEEPGILEDHQFLMFPWTEVHWGNLLYISKLMIWELKKLGPSTIILFPTSLTLFTERELLSNYGIFIYVNPPKV